MRTTKEGDLSYVGECTTHELCCRIVGVDKYGGKQPCGLRATGHYKTSGGGKVYLCGKHRPNPLKGLSDLFGSFCS